MNVLVSSIFFFSGHGGFMDSDVGAGLESFFFFCAWRPNYIAPIILHWVVPYI